jgi:CubicO group peptidase (beta-lactamase class C family)
MNVGEQIEGHVAPGFERVAEEFRRNFRDRGEVGAACAAYVDRKCVVDLWGGLSDGERGTPWKEDTLVVIFSSSKGVAALVVALAASRGYLDYDRTVADYWPEFAANGKQDITVRQLLGHQAGLSYVDGLTTELLGNPRALAPLLAAQTPHWKPGTAHGYHALTIGLYESELLRRVDPAGRGVHQMLQDEIVRPLGLEFYFGVPDSIPDQRIARVGHRPMRKLLPDIVRLPRRLVFGQMTGLTLVGRTMGSVPGFDLANEIWRPPYRGMELAAGNGIGLVRSVARMYGEFAAGGSALGIEPGILRDIEGQPDDLPRGDVDLVLCTPMRFRLGFSKPLGAWQFGTDARAYGTPGAGGSFGCADPATKIGFAYAPTAMGLRLWDDPRELALREAVYHCVRA